MESNFGFMPNFIMRQEVFKYLKESSTLPVDVDRVVISAFVRKNKISVRNNEFLKSFLISEKDLVEYSKVLKLTALLETELDDFNIEKLI